MLFDSKDKLIAAKAGDDAAKGELLNRFRPYLSVIAQRLLDNRIQGRLDHADVVQVTYLEASRDFDDFNGESVESLLAWLRNILKNNIATAHQEHLATQKRSARREIDLGAGRKSDDSSPGIENILPSEASSPSQRMMKGEAAAGKDPRDAARSDPNEVLGGYVPQRHLGSHGKIRNGCCRTTQARPSGATGGDANDAIKPQFLDVVNRTGRVGG